MLPITMFYKRSFAISRILLLSFMVLFFTGCHLAGNHQGSFPSPKGQRGTKAYTINGNTYYPLKSAHGFTEEGIASWYGKDFHGKLTANGERYNMYSMTAAHKTLPLGTKVRVTNKVNGKSIIVRINDRGPFVAGRIIDLTKAGAEKINMLKKGTAPVRLEVIGTSPVAKSSSTTMDGHFFIQTGAFSTKENAEQHASTLRANGNPVRVSYSNNNKMWRVQVGPYNTAMQAQNASRNINGFIVSD